MIKNGLFIIIICMQSWCFASSISFEAKTYLPQNKELYLEDIAVLETQDDSALEALRSIKIADSAQEAESMSVQEIIRKIKPQLKVIERHCDCKLQIHIPKEILEHSLKGSFSEEKLTSRIQNIIKESCTHCIADIQNTNLLRGKVPVDYKHWSTTIDAKALRGTAMVRVYFDENALNPVVYQMFVRIKKPVLKLVHPLPSGTQPQRGDVEIVLMDVTYENRPLATIDDLPETELKRSLGSGEMVSSNDLILKYKIKIGEVIKVIIKNENIEMEMSGVAQKHGRIGDKIPVRLASTRKDVFGEVMEDGRVAL